MGTTSDSDTDESGPIEPLAPHGPLPSAEWFDAQQTRIIAQCKRADEDETKRIVQGLQERAGRELARWVALPCNGELKRVSACPDSFASVCSERAHRMCPRAQVVRLAEEEWERRAQRRQSLVAAGVSERVLKAVYDAEPEETPAVRMLRESLGVSPAPTIVVLQGGVGCGKSCAAAAWAVGHGARWVTAPALGKVSPYDAECDAIRRARALVVDDLGTEYLDPKGFFLANLDDLVNERYAHERPTVVTTNVPAQHFKQRYGERICDRIREAGKFVAVPGGSLRAHK